MRTLHEIYDRIYTNTKFADAIPESINLTSAEFDLLCNALHDEKSSSLGSEKIELVEVADTTPWLTPKYCEGQKVGYSLGVTLNGKIKYTGASGKSNIVSAGIDVLVCSHREPWKPKLFKTIQAAINSAPSSHESVTLWTH